MSTIDTRSNHPAPDGPTRPWRFSALLALPIAGVLLAAGPAASWGDADPREMVRAIFEKADADGNGALTAEEYEAAGLGVYGVGFEDCDADGDGETTIGEYLQLFDSHHGKTPGVSA